MRMRAAMDWASLLSRKGEEEMGKGQSEARERREERRMGRSAGGREG